MCLKETIAKEICLERNMHYASDRHVTNLYVFIRTLWALPYLRSHFFAGMPAAGPSKSINASIQRVSECSDTARTLCGTGTLQVTSLATKGALIPVSDYCVREGEKVASREFEGLIWQFE